MALVAHFVADYLFQTDKQAIEKADNSNYLIKHSIIYSCIVNGFLFLVLNYLSVSTFCILLISHMVLDNRKFIVFWCKFIKRVKCIEKLDRLVLSNVDQTFHILVVFLLSLTK